MLKKGNESQILCHDIVYSWNCENVLANQGHLLPRQSQAMVLLILFKEFNSKQFIFVCEHNAV